MKSKFKIVSAIVFSVVVLVAHSLPLYAMSMTTDFNTELIDDCPHSTLYIFDNDDMTVKEVYKGNRVEYLLMDIEFIGDTAVVLYNGKEITEGEILEGTVIRIYHQSILYGEYTVEELLDPFNFGAVNVLNSVSVNATTTNSNAYGFVLPLDGMSLTNVYNGFGSNYNGPNTRVPNHRGADFPLPNGTPIRAIKSGTVIKSEYHNVEQNSYGYYVQIDHSFGQKSLYAHMKYTPLVSEKQTVSQGQIIGYIGNTGTVDPAPTPANPTLGSHLHLEIQINGTLVNPVTALAGAPTYSSSGSGHVHGYYAGYEGKHPHRAYMQCTCGSFYYTGTYAATYTNTFYEAAHPHKVYGTCTCCGVGYYTGEVKATYTDLFYEAAHPHKVYGTCTCCGAGYYTGEVKATYTDLFYEAAHPHKYYGKCTICGTGHYTGAYATMSSCADCK